MRGLRLIPIAALLGLLIFFLTAHFFGCKKTEQTSGLVGTVVVEGGGADGVTAMLFEDPSRSFSDETVWYTTARQPSVGFAYDPRAAFEWRVEDGSNGLLVATATTDGSGKFNITDQPNGEYILVVTKDGYGWTPPMKVNLNEPTKDIGSLSLYPEESLFGITSGSRTLLADHHYVIPDFELLRVSVGDTLYVEPGAVIRGGDGAEIRVYGSMIAVGQPDKWITFTSNLEYVMGRDDWEGISFQHLAGGQQTGRFSYCRFEHCADAVQSDAASIEMDHCYFASIFGLAVDVSVGKQVISRSVFNSVSSAIRAFAPDSLHLQRNILYSARQTGIDVRNAARGAIECNWFHNCGRFDSTSQEVTGVIYMDHVSNMEITHNHSQSSWYAINLGSGVDSSNHIRYNSYDHVNRVMDIRATAGGATPSFPRFNYNCMTAIANTNIFLHSCERNTEDIDATNNFWDTTSPNVIANRIHGGEDDPSCPMIVFQPYLETCPTDNGICSQ